MGQCTSKKIGSAAWVIQEDAQKDMTACFLMKSISSTTSYRAELEKALCSIKHIKLCGIESMEVEQWFNNLRAVHSTNEEIWGPRGMGKPEADIILAINHLEKDLSIMKEYKHAAFGSSAAVLKKK